MAVVFVVDSNDRERLAAARQELQDVLRVGCLGRGRVQNPNCGWIPGLGLG